MMDKIQPYLDKLDELSLRERVIVTVAVLYVLSMVWQSFLMEPIIQEEKRLIAQLTDKRDQLQTLTDQFVRLMNPQDPNADNRKKLDRLRPQVNTNKQEVIDATAQLVSPEAMPQILRAVLKKSAGLTLMELNGLGSTPLVTAEKQETQNNDLISVFKHGMQIVFEGDYFQTLDYIRKLENLEWGFFWDQVNFEMKEYPQASTTITLYTLSLNPDWIGI